MITRIMLFFSLIILLISIFLPVKVNALGINNAYHNNSSATYMSHKHDVTSAFSNFE